MAAKEAGKEGEALAAIAQTLARIEQQLARQYALPAPAQLDEGCCWRWQATGFVGVLMPLPEPEKETLADLIGLDEQIDAADKNMRQYLAGKPANHVLLTGARGCGKSTLVRGLFSKYRRRGLRLIETDAAGLALLPQLQPLISARAEKFIVYCDDLSFSKSDQLFSRIKNAVDGALMSARGNLLIYATSNRRNLVLEKFSDNLLADDDIQPQETVDEKVALADRFGLWLSFHAPDIDEYEKIAAHWLRHFGIRPTAVLLQQARNFSDQRGSRNGRIAYQFAVSQIR